MEISCTESVGVIKAIIKCFGGHITRSLTFKLVFKAIIMIVLVFDFILKQCIKLSWN